MSSWCLKPETGLDPAKQVTPQSRLSPRKAGSAMARKASIKEKSIKAAWNELKATHGYKVEGDRPNPMIIGKALEAFKGSHDYMFDLPASAQIHTLNGIANGAPRWSLEGFQNRFGQH